MSFAHALPVPTPWSAPYWEASRKKRFVLQCCNACDRLIMYPKRFCPFCLSEDLGWRDSAGTGEIYSITVQRAGAPTGFSEHLPYVLIIVRLDEGVQLMSRLIGPDAETARCGDRVKVDFQDIAGADVTLPVFRLDGAKTPANGSRST
ncbi:Zn-ribbon domain-containing OB-fold protein [Tardiphaga sp. 709]|uniref:Zn-ribbon domain-containing OB-fold protein n=1 Tax=Tardiphaga sp. 709 TaxID=3076039 RepID=UPI0028F09090|nr:OB-fold domain-containing protein [Tardiphaga sp. 709]WNV11829.1 OB-fold domain-containing protein [Tardiphaga sp. 709]